MKSRRKAREAALQALYQCDVLGDWSADTIQRYFTVFRSEQVENSDSSESSMTFSLELIDGVVQRGSEIDSVLSSASEHWTLERMSLVDRNILRIACFEICFREDVPLNVSINEAVELAKSFAADESPQFINGILDNIAKNPVLFDKYAALARKSDQSAQKNSA